MGCTGLRSESSLLGLTLGYGWLTLGLGFGATRMLRTTIYLE